MKELDHYYCSTAPRVDADKVNCGLTLATNTWRLRGLAVDANGHFTKPESRTIIPPPPGNMQVIPRDYDWNPDPIEIWEEVNADNDVNELFVHAYELNSKVCLGADGIKYKFEVAKPHSVSIHDWSAKAVKSALEKHGSGVKVLRKALNKAKWRADQLKRARPAFMVF